MKGKILFVIRKWWVLALVLTLALSLTSCSKKRSNLLSNSFGFGYCDGNLGSFDVYTIPKGNGVDVDLVVIPYQATNGDIIQIGIVNSSATAYKVTTYQATVQVDAEISSMITISDIANYQVLAIRPFTTGGFLDNTGGVDAICALPVPPGFGNGFGSF
ncbi:MAG: hypothetical protein H6617_08205 [Bdellovibrionaceae bacterium]|nr:hypothetical protein [Bdellovibrionales bacterium]MCB9254648.1 hypothetical protein [Pseudobdellovibrionaceae bacterium]